jgi:hypothetical protein
VKLAPSVFVSKPGVSVFDFLNFFRKKTCQKLAISTQNATFVAEIDQSMGFQEKTPIFSPKIGENRR